MTPLEKKRQEKKISDIHARYSKIISNLKDTLSYFKTICVRYEREVCEVTWRHKLNADARQARIDATARAALTGLLAYSYVNPQRGNYHENGTIENACEDAYSYAEALEAERQRRIDAGGDATQ